MNILCLGSLNLDHTYRLHQFLHPGETGHAVSYYVRAGGKGLNQAVAAAKAGARVYMGGCIGPEGEMLMDCLHGSGIDTRYVRRVENATGHAVIQVVDSGENSIIVHSGANFCLSETQIAQTLDAFTKDDLVLVQNETNLVTAIILEAKRRHLKVALNPSPLSEALKSDGILDCIDWLILNQAEFLDLLDAVSVEEGLARMRERYPACQLVLTLGKEGSVYQDGQSRIYQQAYPVEAVDTTGAGDTFAGYFAETYLRTEDPRQALERASLAAAMAVTRYGAADAIPLSEELPKESK